MKLCVGCSSDAVTCRVSQQDDVTIDVVVVLSTASGTELARTLTTDDGGYGFEGLAPGSFEGHVSDAATWTAIEGHAVIDAAHHETQLVEDAPYGLVGAELLEAAPADERGLPDRCRVF